MWRRVLIGAVIAAPALVRHALTQATLLPSRLSGAPDEMSPPASQGGVEEVMLETYASFVIPEPDLDPSFQYFATVILLRIPLDAGASVKEDGGNWYGRDGGWGVGPRVVYVEEGQVVVAVGGKRTSVPRGGSTLVPEQTAFEIRNEGSSCASVLQVAFLISAFGVGGPVPEHPVPTPMRCGKRQLLVSFRESPWTSEPENSSPLLLFLARMSRNAGAPSASSVYVLPHRHSGLAGFAVESGNLHVEVMKSNDIGATSVQSELPAGAQVGIPSGFFHAESPGTETAALVAGLTRVGQAWLIGPHPELVQDARPADPLASARFSIYDTVRTTEANVHLRSAPRSDASVIAELAINSELSISGLPHQRAGEEAVWWPARDENGRGGFVLERFLEAHEAVTSG